MSAIFIASLFDERPWQWGLRGDPYLWEEMQTNFIATPLPETADQLKVALEAEFLSLTGHPINSEQEFIFIERLAHGGMSSGGVSIPFWRETAIPLLIERYNQA